MAAIPAYVINSSEKEDWLTGDRFGQFFYASFSLKRGCIEKSLSIRQASLIFGLQIGKCSMCVNKTPYLCRCFTVLLLFAPRVTDFFDCMDDEKTCNRKTDYKTADTSYRWTLRVG